MNVSNDAFVFHSCSRHCILWIHKGSSTAFYGSSCLGCNMAFCGSSCSKELVNAFLNCDAVFGCKQSSVFENKLCFFSNEECVRLIVLFIRQILVVRFSSVAA